MAKHHGTYKAIESGDVAVALESMTGFPGFDKWIDKYTEDTLWDYMTTELKTGSMIPDLK